MDPAYFETRFHSSVAAVKFPIEFVIVSAHATTGEIWTADQNTKADRALEAELRLQGGWLVRIVGYSPTSGHAEPSWATVMPLDDACDLGQRFRQDTIYHIRDDVLSVTHCDERRRLVRVGSFQSRLDPSFNADDPCL